MSSSVKNLLIQTISAWVEQLAFRSVSSFSENPPDVEGRQLNHCYTQTSGEQLEMLKLQALWIAKKVLLKRPQMKYQGMSLTSVSKIVAETLLLVLFPHS